jgi:hypothetical protein
VVCIIGPWSKVRVLEFIFILFNKMKKDMEIKENAKMLLVNY